MEGPNKITPQEPLEERLASPYDEQTIPSDFIHPTVAKGPDVHVIKSNDIEIPVSFVVNEDGRFRVDGLQEGTEEGVIISGRVAGELVKINHIEIGEQFRGLGIGTVLLADAEKNLSKVGTETIYAAFATGKTVEFFVRNGYTIIPNFFLTEEIKTKLFLNPEDFDDRVSDITIFNSLKDIEADTFRKILLKKELSGNV